MRMVHRLRRWMSRLGIPIVIGLSILAPARGQLPGFPELNCATLGSCAQLQGGDPLERQSFGLRLCRVLEFAAGAAGMIHDAKSAAGLIDIANGHMSTGHLADATASLADARAALPATPSVQEQAAVLAADAAIAALQGHYPQAQTGFEAALQTYLGITTAPAPTVGAGAVSELVARMGRLGVTLDPEAARSSAAQLGGIRDQMERMSAERGAFQMRLNLANVAGELGQYARADQWLEQALQALPTTQRADGERTVLAERAILYERSGRRDEAQALRQRARALGPYRAGSLEAFGFVALSGAAVAPSSDSATAEAERLRPSHYAEAAHARLVAEATAHERAGALDAACETLGRAATLAAVSRMPGREYEAYAAMERLLAERGAADAAVYYGKRAVNLSQGLRDASGGLSREARQGFLAGKRRSYATLARLLLSQQRLAEAEHVLRMLKEDEGQQVLTASAERARAMVPYDAREAAWRAEDSATVARMQALEAESRRRGAAVGSRETQEQLRRAYIGVADGLVVQMTQHLDDGALMRAMEGARRIVVKPGSERSPSEREQAAKASGARQMLLDLVDGQAAALRALQREGGSFLVPLNAEERARLQATLQRAVALRARVDTATQDFAREPPADAAQMAVARRLFEQLYGGGVSAQWGIDRELERLDARQVASAAAVLAARPLAAHDFAPQDSAALDTGPRLLASLPPGSVALYFLSEDDGLEVLLVRPNQRQTFRVPVPRYELDVRVREFRAALQNPRVDAVAGGRALYELLLAPLESALQAAQASTLMLSLDGSLRYLPFAALHDGRGWLAERYAFDLYTTASPEALAAAPASHWRAAAFGASAGGAGLGPLPAVRNELDGVVGSSSGGRSGALPGRSWLDGRFTASSLSGALREGYNVIHIASHFAFEPGDPNASFLLLGDGARLTLAEMAKPEYRFDRVDLVTLSACDTALSGSDAFGQEVEGLGTLLQGQGAAAVLATLWSVADDSTADFMRTLYRLREQGRLSRAQAVRDAQLAMIHGDRGAGAGATRGASRVVAGNAPAAPTDAARPYAHPYFWAPFVLMGNWL